ncbi:MAG TPA: hypothetical protein VJ877_06490 [Bacteroidales bacterium]|jgi:hypothetical protein|nr:hypothetical protein [Bacteroidales bacterium]
MNLLDNLNFTSDKIIEKEKLSNFRGGDGDDCCYLYCDGDYMGNCGIDGTGNGCATAEVPDESCEWRSDNCNNCPDA